MSKVELKLDDVTVYTSGATTPGPTPPGPVVPGPVVPPPGPPVPPAIGALARYDSAPSHTSKAQGLTDAEATILIDSGRTTRLYLANLRQWHFYNGQKSWMQTINADGSYTYTVDVKIGGTWYRKVDSVADPIDRYNVNQPVMPAP